MIRQKTVFVLGAGTGKDFEMPLGSDLALSIHKSLKRATTPGYGGFAINDEEIEKAISRDPTNSNGLKAAADKISNGILLARSIDEFLDSFTDQNHVVELGKIAIASTVLKAEGKSNLYVKPENIYNTVKFEPVRGSWLSLLFQLMTSGIKHSEPEKSFENVSFVNFNYDRCIEQFFHHAMAARFGLGLQQAKHLSDKAEILHPYGFLGKIQPIGHNSNDYFGWAPNIELGDVAKGIQTYTEQLNPENNTISTIRQRISEAELIVFLGFAFHNQNMELLTPANGVRAMRIFATSLGMSDNDTDLVKGWLTSIASSVRMETRLEQVPCSEFIVRYQRSIVA